MTTDRYRVDWNVPATPPGWRGTLGRLMGPGKTRAEGAVEIVGCLVCSVILLATIVDTASWAAWTWWRRLLVAALAVDLVGGVLTNATNAAKRSHHAASDDARRLVFVAAHLLHVALLGLVLLPAGWGFVAFNGVVLLAGGVAIARCPVEAKRALALALWMCAGFVNGAAFELGALAWMPALLHLKLLVCYLVPEAPLYASADGSAEPPPPPPEDRP